MAKQASDGAIVENKVEARQGETSGHMRWVLLVSTALIILGFVALYFIFK